MKQPIRRSATGAVLHALLLLSLLGLLSGPWALTPAAADGPQPGAPWPQFKRDGARTGLATVNGPLQPAKSWAYDAGSPITGGPVVASDGIIYIVTQDAKVRAITPNGTERWTYSFGSGTATHPMVIERGDVVVGLESGRVVGLKPGDGTVDFSLDIRTAPYGENAPNGSTPILGHPGGATNARNYLIGTDNGILYLMEGGGVAGVRRAGGSIRAGASFAPDGSIIMASFDKYLAADQPGGGDRWRYELDGKPLATPAIARDGTIYAATDVGSVYAVSAAGKLRWRVTPGPSWPILSSPAIGPDGTVYVGSLDSKLYALDPASGSVRWSYGAYAPIVSTPAVGANGLIYVGSTDSFLYVLAPDGRAQAAFKTDGSIDLSSPAIGADGTLYVGSRDGKLYALKEAVSSEAQALPAPTATPAPTPPASAPALAPATLPLPTDRASPLAEGLYFYETGHNVIGPFLDFFNAKGGLEQFGYPRTEIVIESGHPAQWFQRARLEWIPERAGTPDAVQLTPLGYLVAGAQLPFPVAAPFASADDARYFPETEHGVRGVFLGYFDANGGLERFGYPLSDEIEEPASDGSGSMLTVQYFQFGRLERHPDQAGTPLEIQQSLVGDMVLRAAGWLKG